MLRHNFLRVSYPENFIHGGQCSDHVVRLHGGKKYEEHWDMPGHTAHDSGTARVFFLYRGTL